MGSVEGSAVKESGARDSSPLPGYQRLDGEIPVFHPPHLEERAAEVRELLEVGTTVLSEVLEIEPRCTLPLELAWHEGDTPAPLNAIVAIARDVRDANEWV